MTVKKWHLFAVFAVFFTISLSMVLTTSIAVADTKTASGLEDPIANEVVADTVEKPSSSGVSGGLQVGDIICHRPSDKKGGLIPGRYSHAQIYVGNGKVVESNPGSGVHYSSISYGEVYRVSTSSSKKSGATNFAKAQVGKNYDYWLVSKQVYGSRYYCSEVIWAGYKHVGGPDIDQNPGWSWTYANGVAPTELADDGDTYYVGSF